jgi:hypothetical protein
MPSWCRGLQAETDRLRADVERLTAERDAAVQRAKRAEGLLAGLPEFLLRRCDLIGLSDADHHMLNRLHSALRREWE